MTRARIVYFNAFILDLSARRGGEQGEKEMKIAMIILLTALVLPLATRSEEIPEDIGSEYSQQALRVKYSFFSTNIVQGHENNKIAGMGMFGGDVDFLSEREDEIGIKFRSYRSKKTTSGVLYLLSLGAVVGSVLTHDQYSNDNGTSTAILVGALGLLIGGAAVNVSAYESLSRSIWMYNGTLSTDGPIPGLEQEKKHGETHQELDLR